MFGLGLQEEERKCRSDSTLPHSFFICRCQLHHKKAAARNTKRAPYLCLKRRQSGRHFSLCAVCFVLHLHLGTRHHSHFRGRRRRHVYERTTPISVDHVFPRLPQFPFYGEVAVPGTLFGRSSASICGAATHSLCMSTRLVRSGGVG